MKSKWAAKAIIIVLLLINENKILIITIQAVKY